MTTQIRALNQDVSIFSTQFNRFGIFAIGARATSIQLKNKDIIIVSPVPHTDKIGSYLASLGGKVAYLVAPDREHHLNLDAWSKIYPDAQLVAVSGVPEKHKDLKFLKVFGEKKYDDVALPWPGVKTAYFPGHVNKELALFHEPSKVLVEADLLFNLPAYEQYPNASSSAGLIGGWISPFRFLGAASGAHKFFNYYLAAQNKAQMITSLDEMRGWDFETIVPCHGEVITEKARDVWYDTFAWLF